MSQFIIKSFEQSAGKWKNHQFNTWLLLITILPILLSSVLKSVIFWDVDLLLGACPSKGGVSLSCTDYKDPKAHCMSLSCRIMYLSVFYVMVKLDLSQIDHESHSNEFFSCSKSVENITNCGAKKWQWQHTDSQESSGSSVSISPIHCTQDVRSARVTAVMETLPVTLELSHVSQ